MRSRKSLSLLDRTKSQDQLIKSNPFLLEQRHLRHQVIQVMPSIEVYILRSLTYSFNIISLNCLNVKLISTFDKSCSFCLCVTIDVSYNLIKSFGIFLYVFL